ncbi:MAG: GNAT family protein [Clostridia bacterium]
MMMKDMGGNCLLSGDKVFLDALEEADIPILASWYRDTEFLRNYDFDPAFPKSEEQLKSMYLGQQKETSAIFAIREQRTGKLVGLCGLMNISFSNRFSWIFIGLGSDQGKGYGTQALSLLIRFAFHELNLERLQLNVIAYNHRAIALYEKLGFRREGAFRQAILRDGKRTDLLLYGLLAGEWTEG